MPQATCGSRSLFLAALIAFAPAAQAAVGGVCSVVDSAKRTFRGATGFAGSPVLVPGFPAELSVPTGICDADSTAPDFKLDGTELTPSDLALTFVFTPEVGPINAVVLSRDCEGLNTSTCNGMGMPVNCVTAGPSDLLFLEGEPFPGTGLPDPPARRVLRYVFPDTTPFVNVCLDGAQTGEFCRDSGDCGGSACGRTCVGGTQHGQSCAGGCNLGRCGMPLTGPVAVAATLQTAAQNDPIPCDLATVSCAASAPGQRISCVDNIYRFDGTCRTTEAERDADAFNMTAQPSPVALGDVCSLDLDPSRNKCINGDDVGSLCASDADCTNGACGVCRIPNGLSPMVPVAQDKAGRLSSVVSANGVLVIVDGESFPWLVQGATEFQGTPLRPAGSIPRDLNFSPLNPLFFGVPDPLRPGLNIASVDAPFALQQSTRFACAEDLSVACTKSSPGCTCNADSLAPLPSPLPGYASGAGPALLNVPLESPGGPPVVQLLGTVTIDTLFAARKAGRIDTAVAAPVSECLADTLPDGLANGDSDSEDVLMTLIDTRTGRRVPLPDGLARATTRVVDRGPFSLPTHDVEASVLAFLEDEFHACDFGAGDCDLDGNGIPFGHVLRVFDVDQPGVDRSPMNPDGRLFAAQPDLNVNLSAVAVSNGMVFFRAPASTATRTLTTVSAPGGGETSEPSVSADGGFVGFTGQKMLPTSFVSESGFSVELMLGPNGELATGDGAGNSVFTYQIRGKGVDDDAKCEINRAASKVLLALPSPTCAESLGIAGSAPEGVLLAEGDASTGFGEGDPDTDVFLWDETVSCNGTSTVTITITGPPRVTSDEFALKVGGAAELGTIAGPGCRSSQAVFVEGPGGVTLASAQTRTSCAEPPVASDGDSSAASISAGGAYVAYQSQSTDLIGSGADQNGVSDVFVFDAATCSQARVSEPTGGGEANGAAFSPSISASGERVVFASFATNLTGTSQPAGAVGVYLHDRTTGTTQFVAAGGTPDVSEGGDATFADGGDVKTSSAGTLGAGLRPVISADGRWVSFETGGPSSDVLVVDLDAPGSTPFRAGIARVPRECRERFTSVDFEPLGALNEAQVSEDGRFLFYTSDAPNLIPDGSAVATVYVEDRKTGAVAKLGVAADGTLPDAPVGDPSASGEGSAVAFSTAATNLGAAAAGTQVLVSELEIASAGRSVLGVWDPNAGFLTGFGDMAEFVKVANGAAVFIAEGSAKLFRLDCGSTGCTPLVEDLLRIPAALAADALSISDTHACVVIEEAGAAVPACHEIGAPPTASLDNIASGAGPECAQAKTIQLVNQTVVYTTPAGKLCQAQLGSGLAPQPVLCDGAHCSASATVLGPDEVVCFANPETANGNVMFVSDARTSDEAVSCEEPVVACPLSVCDPRQAFTQEPSRTCKFLKPNPAATPGPEPRPEDFLVVRCALGFDNLIVANSNDIGAGSDPFGLTGTGDGDVTRRPGCVDPATPTIFEGECPCTPSQAAVGFVCSDTLGILATDNAGDQDGDGVSDADEICDVAFNPDVGDADGDGFPDACDGCLINGQLDEGEQCDPLIADPFSVFCTDECELVLPTSFTTASGYTVELLRDQNGELVTDDGQGNSTYSYQIRGKGVDDDSKCFKVRAASKLFEALPVPTCTGAPLVIVWSDPSGNLLANGDKATGYGRDDPDTAVFEWGETVSCNSMSSVSLTVQGPPSPAANGFALKVGKNAESGVIIGPGCPVP